MISFHRHVILLIFMAFLMMVPAHQVAGSSEAEFQVRASRIAVNGNYSWEVYKDEQLLFEANSGGEDVSYSWDFGDGAYSTTDHITITHSYPTLGTYTVILEIEDEGENTASQTGLITVVERPVAKLMLRHPYSNAILDPETYEFEPGDEVILDGSGSSGDIRIYYFGYDLNNAFIPQAQNTLPTMKVKYSEPGEYKLGLRVFDHLGNTSQVPKEEFITIQVGTIREPSDEEEGQYSFQLDPFFATLVILGLIGSLIKVRGGRREPQDHIWGSTSIPFHGDDDIHGIPHGGEKAVKPFHAQSISRYQSQLEPERTITSTHGAPTFRSTSTDDSPFRPKAK